MNIEKFFNNHPGMTRNFSRSISTLLILVIIYGVFSIRIFRVDGDSMSPNLEAEMLVIVDKISPKILGYFRGNIVVYHDKGGNFVKRILGTPTETLQISDGKIFLLDEYKLFLISEKYLSQNVKTCVPGSCINTKSHIYNVPDNHYFILGDNRKNSSDSRGCTSHDNCDTAEPHYIPKHEIIGKVIAHW